MVARNFLETDNNIFYPRIDNAGEKTGITGMEFPLFNYLIYLISVVFGYEHWYGRLINLIVSSLGLLFFSKLVTKYFNRQVAFNATIILAVSIWFQYSRKVMPDTFATSLLIAGLWYGSEFLQPKPGRKNILNLLLFLILVMLGALSKIPVAYLLILCGLFCLLPEIPLRRKVILMVTVLIALIPALIWYFYWVPFLVKTYGFWHFFMGKDFLPGGIEIIRNLPQTMERFYDTALKFSGFAAFILGLIVALVVKEKKILWVLISSFIFFSFVIIKSGYNFPHHSYYVIPFVPVMALVAGFAISRIKDTRITTLVLIIISFEGIANQWHDFRIKDKDRFMVHLSVDLDKVSDRKDLFLVNSDQNPTPLYFAHRKGWVCPNERIVDKQFIDELKNKGLKFILVLKRSLGKEVRIENLQVVTDNDNYCLYSFQDL